MLIRSTKSRILMRGTTTVSHSAAGILTTPVDISSAGITDITKVVERLNGYAFNVNHTSFYAGILITTIANINIYTRAVAACTIYVSWEIKQARNSVQRGYTDMTTVTSGVTTANTPITTVPNINFSKAYNNGGYPTSGTASYNIRNHLRQTSTSNLIHYLSTSNVSGVTFRAFWAVEK